MNARPVPYTAKPKVKAKLKHSEDTAMLKPDSMSERIKLRN